MITPQFIDPRLWWCVCVCVSLWLQETPLGWPQDQGMFSFLLLSFVSAL